MATKQCKRCKQTKPIDDFPKDPLCTRDGHRRQCKQCRYRRINVLSVTEKKCKKCGDIKPATEFWIGKRYEDGLRAWCKQCTMPVARAQGIRWRRRRWIKCMLLRARRNNSAYPERPFDLTEQDIEILWDNQQGNCYWFGIPMDPEAGTAGLSRPSLDKLDPTKGYTAGNVVLACWAANACRGRHDPDTFRSFLESLRHSWQEEGRSESRHTIGHPSQRIALGDGGSDTKRTPRKRVE